MKLSARVLIFVLLSFGGVAVARESAATQADLQALFDGAHYQELLPKLNQAIAAQGPAAAGYDRYKLFILKGETQLRLPSGKSAMDAFKSAIPLASNPNDADVSRATALLINRSSNNKFTPKKTTSNAKPTAISIVESSDRKQAFEALFIELTDEAKPELDRAVQVTSLVALMNTAQKFGDIRPVEIASTGTDDRSKEALKPLATQAETLMTAALKNLDTQEATLEKDAAKREGSYRGLRGGKTGLNEDTATDLRSLATQAKQISQAAVQMQTTFGDAGDFKSVESDANKTFENVNKTLTKYGQRPAT